jgi:hypothetical protein
VPCLAVADPVMLRVMIWARECGRGARTKLGKPRGNRYAYQISAIPCGSARRLLFRVTGLSNNEGPPGVVHGARACVLRRRSGTIGALGGTILISESSDMYAPSFDVLGYKTLFSSLKARRTRRSRSLVLTAPALCRCSTISATRVHLWAESRSASFFAAGDRPFAICFLRCHLIRSRSRFCSRK